MAGLLSAAELGAIEEIAELGMETPVSVLRYTSVPREDSDDQQVWATLENTTAMIWAPYANPRPGIEGGVVGDPELVTALVRSSVDVRPGDRLGVDGEMFMVTGSNVFDTYRAATQLALRRHE